ncbi:MAG: hypothetical protein KBC56_07290, partial [Flavobacterium sp.]|nr:hypothetical protein [Flavobacterium sp.]
MSEYSNKGLNITASCSFPSQLAPYSEKKDESFGLDVARAIESEWFYGNGGGCKFYTSRSEMLLRRAYAKGIQPMHKYFTGLGTNGDKSYLNLPQKPISIIPKLVAMVCNGMAERDYVIKANAIDKLSQNKRKDYRDRVENDFLAKDIIVKAQETLGADIGTMPLDQLPETNEELDLHMQLKYKPSIEISAEVAIDVVFQENEYKETVASRNRKDLTVLGVAWAKHDFIPTRGIVQK